MFSPATKEAAKVTAASAKRDLRDVSDDARSELTVLAEKAGSEVRHFVDSTSQQFEQVSDRVSHEISNHPVRSAAIALGLGVLLGALIRR